MSAEEDSYIPTERLLVAQLEMTRVEYTKKPDAIGWIVRKKGDPNKPFRFRFLPEARHAIRRIYPNIPIEERQGAFIWGYPLRRLEKFIHTCGTSTGRPKILYRLTRDGQPHGGRKPRGHGLVDVDPFSFHIFFQKHLSWRCRNPSPFLSVTDSFEKVKDMHKLYQKRGYQNIKLIKFRSYGPGWDHTKLRLYHVPTLTRLLGGVPCMKYMYREFLVDGEIPHQSIIKEWVLTPGYPGRPKKKRKSPARTSKSTVRDNEKGKRRRATAFKLRI
ncbi:hypothetical protein CHU98_g3893 [Xylaria longipes]|nr:hypothetical protein CHU98_g3893 [Xylaria longipes]